MKILRRLRSAFRRRLAAWRQRRMVLRSFRLLHGARRVRLAEDEFAVIALVKDAEWFVETLLRHHFALGAAHVVLVDNGSTDRTVEIARAFPDVTVLQSRLPPGTFEVQLRALGGRRVLRGGWVLFADSDELLDLPCGASPRDLLRYCNGQGFTAVVGQMLDLYAPAATPGAAYAEAVMECTRYSLEALDRIAYHDAGRNILYWFMRENVCEDPGVMLLAGGLRREVFAEEPFLSKHSFVRNRPGIEIMTHPHSAGGVRVADVTVVLRHYKFAGDWQARDRATRDAATWQEDADARRLAVAARPSFRIAPARPLAWGGPDLLVEQGFLCVSPRARAALSLRPGAAAQNRMPTFSDTTSAE